MTSSLAELHDLLARRVRDRAIFLLDPSGTILSWNPGVEQLLGFSEHEWVGQPGAMIFTTEDQQKGEPEDEMRRAQNQGQAADIRWHVKKDGSHLFAEGALVALRDDAGTLLGYGKILLDATERRLYEKRLEELTHALQQAQTSLRSLDGTILFWSDGCERLYGYSKAEAIGERFDLLLKTEFPKPVSELVDEVLREGLWHGELRHRRKDGAMLIASTDWVLHDSSIIIDSSSDISDRMNLEKEREELLSKLQRSNQELAQFSYVVSHDLKAPLRRMKIFAQLLARKYERQLDETGDTYIRTILEGAESMEDLIGSLLEYAQAGEEHAERERVDLATVLNTALETLHPLIEESGAEVTHDPRLAAVYANRVQMQQLFQNLLTNALKYRAPERTPRVHVGCQPDRGAWIFCVSDNGIGISPVNFERIFEPLKRLHGSEIPGSGIGLAVCRKIVERHGGRIWVESLPGQGSQFYFTLPA